MPLTNVGKWTVLYSVVAVELGALAASWRLWDNLNRRPGYRKWMYENHPRVMEVFYWSCGWVGVPDAKERDLREWGTEVKRRTS